jgi:hypothetical protein
VAISGKDGDCEKTVVVLEQGLVTVRGNYSAAISQGVLGELPVACIKLFRRMFPRNCFPEKRKCSRSELISSLEEMLADKFFNLLYKNSFYVAENVEHMCKSCMTGVRKM